MVIDVHTHVVPADVLAEVTRHPDPFGISVAADPQGPRFRFAGGPPAHPLWSSLSDRQARLAVMASMGVERQLLSLSPELVGYGLGRAEGARWSQLVNDAIAAEAASLPERFWGCATVPLQDPAAAAAELERAVTRLSMRAVLLGSNVGGTYLDHAEFDPFWATVQALGVPIFLHPVDPPGLERLGRYRMHAVVGFPVETAVSVSYLVLGGVLHRHPRLQFLLSHGGGCLPAVWGRLGGAYERQPAVRAGAPEPPERYRPAFWFDTLTHDPLLLANLAQWAGSDRVLLGSDYPFPHTDPAPLLTLERSELGAADRARIAGGNALRLLSPGAA